MMNKSLSMRSAEHAACMRDMRKGYNILVRGTRKE
jgi:hypothetical protein